MQADVANRKQSLSLPSENVNVQQNFFCNANKQNAVQCEAAKKDGKEKKEKSEQEKQNAKDGIRTRASEEIGALNRRLRPTRPPPLVLISELQGSVSVHRTNLPRPRCAGQHRLWTKAHCRRPRRSLGRVSRYDRD